MKLHMTPPEDLVRSVLLGVEVASACGRMEVHTREGVERAMGSKRKTCHACLVAVDEISREIETTIHPSKGWTALLERAYLLEHAPRPRPSATWTIRIPAHPRGGFPLAG